MNEEIEEEIENYENNKDIQHLLDFIQKYLNNEEIIEEVLSALYRVVLSITTLDSLDLNNEYIVDVFTKCLKQYTDEPSIVEILFGIMRCFVKLNIDLQNRFCTIDLIENYIVLFNQYIESEEGVQEQGCLLIHALSMNNNNNIKFLNDKNIRIQLEQAKELISNERNKKYPIQAMESLGLC